MTINKPKPRKKRDDDSELIEAINSGQKNLFFDLVKRYQQPLYNFGLRMCRDIERHARECIRCKTCLDTLKRTIDLCRNTGDKPLPETFSFRLKEFIQIFQYS